MKILEESDASKYNRQEKDKGGNLSNIDGDEQRYVGYKNKAK